MDKTRLNIWDGKDSEWWKEVWNSITSGARLLRLAVWPWWKKHELNHAYFNEMPPQGAEWPLNLQTNGYIRLHANQWCFNWLIFPSFVPPYPPGYGLPSKQLEVHPSRRPDQRNMPSTSAMERDGEGRFFFLKRLGFAWKWWLEKKTSRKMVGKNGDLPCRK